MIVAMGSEKAVWERLMQVGWIENVGKGILESTHEVEVEAVAAIRSSAVAIEHGKWFIVIQILQVHVAVFQGWHLAAANADGWLLLSGIGSSLNATANAGNGGGRIVSGLQNVDVWLQV